MQQSRKTIHSHETHYPDYDTDHCKCAKYQQQSPECDEFDEESEVWMRWQVDECECSKMNEVIASD